MFVQHRNRNMVEAAFSTLLLMYFQTIHVLRSEHRNPLIGLLLAIVQSSLMVAVFFALYYVIGVRTSPIRGDFMIFIMSGIFVFVTHVQATGAVSGSGALTSGMTKHGPMNSAILIAGAAIAVLYRQVLSCVVILGAYHAFITPVIINDWVSCMGLLLLAWLSGCCVGLVFLSMRPWAPKASGLLTTVYSRLNMIASGKMFVANTLPNFMLPYFAWNPLFHIIDQMRGYAFINYVPHKTNLAYPIYFTITVAMIGLMAEFVTRNRVSASWTAGR
ncbi:ABC transporter permease [Paracoccus tegillarcae]|uniref:ABC transporter n=1 Tax=Paracoccus tegillarcae TaxID=1529068 RepID=A0A2K9EP04_9RHOB|nr:ABC transporter [Paracoccus tegillarcae]AUH35207.1 ABC transporter [Paracoccus tegillarcae]